MHKSTNPAQSTVRQWFAVVGLCVAGILAPGASAAPWVGQDFQGNDCEGFQGTAGTHDYLHRYRPRVAGFLALTEEHHFNEDVEALRKGMTTEPMGDIDFVLRSFPNHHRALYSAMQYRLKHPRWPKNAKWQKAECYYHRAVNFSPRDLTVRSQFAILQYKFKKYEDALESYRAADKLNPDDPLLLYNMGLTLVKLKKFQEAKVVADRVYAMNFPLPGLRNKLVTAGYWEDETTPDSLEDKAEKRLKEMEAEAQANDVQSVRHTAGQAPAKATAS
jgi:tetratricopeptide (TPR) repeat protein